MVKYSHRGLHIPNYSNNVPALALSDFHQTNKQNEFSRWSKSQNQEKQQYHVH